MQESTEPIIPFQKQASFKIDLSNVNLVQADLHDLDLSHVNLTAAHLY